MNVVGTGLVLIANGAVEIATALFSPVALVGVAALVALWWLATIEIEELNRLGVKPDVPRH